MNGIESQFGDRLEVIRLNLLSPIGRQAGRAYGVRIVPVALLFDGRGEIAARQTGLPDAEQLVERIRRLGSVSAAGDRQV